MPFDGSVSAQQAAEARRAKLSAPQKRKVPKMMGLFQKLKDGRKHRIFNVGPWVHQINTGSTGTFYIPACPTRQQCQENGTKYLEYVEMTRPVDAIMDELIVKSEVEYDRLMDEGEQFAREILGLGRGSMPGYALTHSGCFLAEGEKPTEKELADANKLLRARCSEIVADIRAVYATDRKLFQQVVRPIIHYAAAQVLNLQNEVWMLDSAPSSQVKCKMCGEMCDADVAVCKGGHIINPELYAEYMAEQDELVAAATAPKPKGKAK